MKRLVGSDGSLSTGKLGDDIVVGGSLEIGTFYQVKAIDDTASVFPIGILPGFIFRSAIAGTLATDDVCNELELSVICDIQTWAMDFSKAEIDVTTLCDEAKAYRASKYDDITGSIEGIMTIDITDVEGGLMNQFVTIVEQGAQYTISPKAGVNLYVQLITDDTTVVDEFFSFYFTPVVLTGFSASAGGDDAQSFSTPFRVGPSEAGVVYYKVLNA